MDEWYCTKMGIQQGPVSGDELRQKIRRGEIGDSNLIWREGMADWLPCAQIPELRGGVTTEPPGEVLRSPSPPAELPEDVPPFTSQSQETPAQISQPASQGAMQMQQPPAYHGDYVAPNIPTYFWQSLAALGLSCLMMLLVCLPVGLPFAIVALVYASKVDGLKAQGMMVEASSASSSAKMWVIISFSLTGLLILAFLGLLAFAFSASSV